MKQKAIEIVEKAQNSVRDIFDKYVSYAKRYRQLGTGLGLYVAKKIVELHNGEIEVTSTVKKGSSFILKLPIEEITN